MEGLTLERIAASGLFEFWCGRLRNRVFAFLLHGDELTWYGDALTEYERGRITRSLRPL